MSLSLSKHFFYHFYSNSPMTFSLFKEDQADQTFGFCAWMVRSAKRRILLTELVTLLVLPML